MTVSSTVSRQSYAGNGSTTIFAFPYYFLRAEDLVVIKKNNTTGAETLLVLNTDYTVSGAGVQAGGAVTTIGAGSPLATGFTLTIYRDPTLTQEVDLVENDAAPAEVTEKALDRLTMIDQRSQDWISRTAKLSDGMPPNVFDPTWPVDINLYPNRVPMINDDGDGFDLAVNWPSAADVAAAAANAAAAAASAAAALASETAAAASAVAADASADAAALSETNAAASAVAADASADAAALSETNAAASAVAADASADAAALSETNAASSASDAADSAVDAAASAAVAAGGGGGGSLKWVEGVQSPTPNINDAGMEVYDYAAGDDQSVYALVKVPSGYTPGNAIKLKTFFFLPDTSGNVLMKTISTLIRPGTDVYNTTTNQHTSTNAAVTLSGATANKPQAIEFDLSEPDGEINGVAVAPGDLIKVQLIRGADTATGDVSVPVYATEGRFT